VNPQLDCQAALRRRLRYPATGTFGIAARQKDQGVAGKGWLHHPTAQYGLNRHRPRFDGGARSSVILIAPPASGVSLPPSKKVFSATVVNTSQHHPPLTGAKATQNISSCGKDCDANDVFANETFFIRNIGFPE
jgi:hypothetical protein